MKHEYQLSSAWDDYISTACWHICSRKVPCVRWYLQLWHRSSPTGANQELRDAKGILSVGGCARLCVRLAPLWCLRCRRSLVCRGQDLDGHHLEHGLVDDAALAEALLTAPISAAVHMFRPSLLC